jgi:Bacterial phospho-glucose isomerase C-terminal SIS domain
VLDEALLDDPHALTRDDTHSLLRSLASAGARVRTAARLADEAGLSALRPDGRPRNVLVAGRGAASAAGELLGAVAGSACPVLPLRATPAPPRARDTEPRWTLPGWVGPLDLLLLAAPAGQEPGLATLVEHAYQRGCSVVTVAPAGSPLADATQQARGLALPFAPPPHAHANPYAPPQRWGEPGPAPAGEAVEDASALWALLVPLLALADRIGTATAPADAIETAATRLDEMAGRCGPATPTYQNPAKTLAVELAESLPLLWSEGPISEAVARRFAACLAARAGRPALTGALPDALTDHRALLSGTFSPTDDEDDFFRDRVEEPQAPRLRVVLVREHADETAAGDATPAHRLVQAHGTALSEAVATADSPLERVAQLLALTDFASAYLALAEGP